MFFEASEQRNACVCQGQVALRLSVTLEPRVQGESQEDLSQLECDYVAAYWAHWRVVRDQTEKAGEALVTGFIPSQVQSISASAL